MRVIRGLRCRHFDLAISMCRSFSQSSAWLAYASGAAWRLGYLAPPAHLLGFFLNLGKDGRPTALHEVDCCLELLASAGIPAAGRKLTLVPDPDVRAAVGQRLGEAAAPAGSKLVLLHISNRREDRQWPLPFFARAADLLREHLGLSILLSWSPGNPRNPLFPGDDGKAEEVAAMMRMRPILLRTPTLEELIAAVSLSDLVLTTDGGLMHIAAALDVPQVVPFGPTDPRHWGPVSQRSVVLQRGGRADCISVEEVVGAAAAVMSRWAGMRAPSAARFPDTMQAVPRREG
jgi:ADP-heptose:LPS heptosyltransferase